MKTVLYIGGRSGGHIVPLVSDAKKNKNKKNIFITTSTELDYNIISQNKDIIDEHYVLTLENIPSLKKPLKFFLYCFSFFKSFYQCIKIIHNLKKKYGDVDAVYTTGGYIGLCGTLAAKLLKIPVHVYHLDVSPGRAGKLIHRYATSSLICFLQTKKYLSSKNLKAVKKCSYPIRFEKISLSKSEVCFQLGIKKNKYVLLILGGSQGSVQINIFIKDLVSLFSDSEKEHIFILHQTGKEHVDEIEAFYKNAGVGYSVFGYYKNVEFLYTAADYIVARAGAGTIAEILFFKKQCLLIPLKNVARNHQVINAQTAVKEHGDLFAYELSVDSSTSKKLYNTLCCKMYDAKKLCEVPSKTYKVYNKL